MTRNSAVSADLFRSKTLARLGAAALCAALSLVGCSGGGPADEPASPSTPVVPAPAPTPAPPSVALAVDPVTVQQAAAANLHWTSSNASACDASGGWSGIKDVTGVESTGALVATTSYTLTCSGSGGTAGQTVTANVTAPPSVPPGPSVSLSAVPSTVDSGGAATLTWSSTDATNCSASGNWSGSKATSGSASTGPLTANSSFALTCTGAGGSATQSVNVTVIPPQGPPPPSVTLGATPTTVASGGGTTLNWTVTNATSCTASGGWTGSKTLSGSEARSGLSFTTTYTLTCTGAGGAASQLVTVTVTPPSNPPSPTVTLSASPTTVANGGTSTLSWLTANTSGCTASGGWTGTKALSGSEARTGLTATTTFTLTCSGTGGGSSASQSITVSVSPPVTPPPPAVTLTATPSSIASGGTTTLGWSASNATACTASGGWSGSKPLSGSEAKSGMTSTTTYVLTCTGAGGSGSQIGDRERHPAQSAADPCSQCQPECNRAGKCFDSHVEHGQCNVLRGDWRLDRHQGDQRRAGDGRAEFHSDLHVHTCLHRVGGLDHAIGECRGQCPAAGAHCHSVRESGPGGAGRHVDVDLEFEQRKQLLGFRRMDRHQGNLRHASDLRFGADDNVHADLHWSRRLGVEECNGHCGAGHAGTHTGIDGLAEFGRSGRVLNTQLDDHECGLVCRQWRLERHQGRERQPVDRRAEQRADLLVCAHLHGRRGTTSRTVTVVVSATPPVPTVTISANSEPDRTGRHVDDHLVVDQRDIVHRVGRLERNQSTSGTQTTAALTQTTSFVLTCSGAGGSASNTATVTVTAPPATTAFPLRVGADQRHLVDQNGKAFLVVGDTPWSIFTAITKADAEAYLEDRRQRGFNAIIVNIIEHFFNGPVNQDGQAPFTKTGAVYDFSKPNNAYFAHVDYVLGLARDKGMLVLMTPAYLGYGGGTEGWWPEINTAVNTEAVMENYGRYLGTRYRTFNNVIWVMGGDYYAAATLAKTRAIVRGIQATDQARLFTAHNARQESGLLYYTSESWFTVNTTYSDCTLTPQRSIEDYQRARVMPFVYFEGRYENEGGASAVCLRSQAYWPVLLGAVGAYFGNAPIWNFDAGWQAALGSGGARSMTYFRKLFLSRAWDKLVPDTAGTVLTAGRGALGADYAAAARTSDGASIIVYAPSQRALTVDMSKVSGTSARAWWFNPSTGTAALIGDFPTSGARSFTPAAAGDWVLVVDDASLGLAAPGQ